jgi:dihydrofolate reductase
MLARANFAMKPGYIAGPKGEFDWIKADPEFAGRTSMPGMKTIVVSRTLRPEDYAEVVIVPGIESLTDLKASPGKDIWLFGGGRLFRSLAEAGMVDTVEVSVIPILLGDGVSLAPNLSKWINLSLVNHKVFSSGAVSLEYAIRSNRPGLTA